VSPGYFGQPARGAAEVRTGDLGYLAAGELYVVDRLKDLVILRGRNFAPSDLERTIAQVRGVTRGSIVAFATPGEDGTEALVVVAALDPTSMQTRNQIKSDIARVLAETFSITGAEVHLVAPGTIPKTSSGKVQRRACRALYLAGELEEVESVAQRAGFFANRLKARIGAALSDD
jgi:acyl-CoA synthetase (AMP-forming)/AMP-acid ligase II